MNSALCFIGLFFNKMLERRVNYGGRQVGGEKEGCVARVHHAEYLLKSYYTRLSLLFNAELHLCCPLQCC